jgi:hypothetical protein
MNAPARFRFLQRPARSLRSQAVRLLACLALLAVPLTAKAAVIIIDEVKPDGQGTTGVWVSENWPKGFTSLVTFTLGGEPHLLSYNRETDLVTIHRIRPEGNAPTLLVEQVLEDDENYSSLFAFELNARPHFLAYSSATGDIDIYRSLPDGDGIELVQEYTWETGWNIFMPFQLAGRPYFATFDTETRRYVVYNIGSDAGLTQIYVNQWTTPWSAFMPFVHAGLPHFLTYQKETGERTIQRIRPDGKGTDELPNSRLLTTPGATARAPFVLNGQTHYVSYNGTNGDVGFLRVKPNNAEVELLRHEVWRAGFTSVVSFMMGGRPHLIWYDGGTL